MMITIPALWLTAMPALPAAVGGLPAAVLALLGLLCIAVVALLRFDRSSSGRGGLPPRDGTAIAAERLAAFRRFLAARDGTPDLLRHTLSRREAFFAALDAAPLRARADLDRAAYARNLRRRRIEAGLNPRILWLLASAKSNQAERFGVGLGELYGRVPSVDEDPVRVHLHLQETYHTRILADVVAIFGLRVHAGPPPLWTRALIKSMVLAPPRWVLPLVGASEMIGCVLFRALRDRGVALFAGEAAVAERVRLLYDEILADELSHVGYIASQLGPRGLALMRWLAPRLGSTFARQMPELQQLFDPAELTERFRHFRLAAMLAEFPATSYATALI